MKLRDLFEDQQHRTTGSESNYSGTFKQAPGAFNDSRSGAYSTVRDDKTDPHMVKKYNHGPMDDSPDSETGQDGYEQFVQWLIKKNVNNPNIVRVYDAKKIKDSTGKYIYRYQLEKLIEGKALDIDELNGVYERYFNTDAPLSISYKHLKNVEGLKRLEGAQLNEIKNDFIRMMGYLCTKTIKGEKGLITDETLLEALGIVGEFVKAHSDLWLDLENAGNIMFRRGQYGYQLVITDPVA